MQPRKYSATELANMAKVNKLFTVRVSAKALRVYAPRTIGAVTGRVTRERHARATQQQQEA